MTARKKPTTAPPSTGNPPVERGVFTAKEVDVRALVLRWDALHEAPSLHLGGVDEWTAHAWLSAACEQLALRLGEIVIEVEG